VTGYAATLASPVTPLLLTGRENSNRFAGNLTPLTQVTGYAATLASPVTPLLLTGHENLTASLATSHT
jgi:hypothetical protein